MKPFSEIAPELEPDGALRDFYIFDIHTGDWQTFLDHIRPKVDPTCFVIGGETAALPQTREEIRKNNIQPGGIVFYDAVVLLGTPYVNQTEKEVRLVGYRVENVDYWIATDRHDLSAEQIAFAYKLRWEHRDFLRLVETPSEGLPPYFKEPIWADGPDAGRIDHLHPLGHLLP
mgnify:CR=1 FL=1